MRQVLSEGREKSFGRPRILLDALMIVLSSTQTHHLYNGAQETHHGIELSHRLY